MRKLTVYVYTNVFTSSSGGPECKLEATYTVPCPSVGSRDLIVGCVITARGVIDHEPVDNQTDRLEVKVRPETFSSFGTVIKVAMRHTRHTKEPFFWSQLMVRVGHR